ncbi:unnamed protein product [Effrenium voratum]|nr:unnamed protein product [Effrenium voratum]
MALADIERRLRLVEQEQEVSDEWAEGVDRSRSLVGWKIWHLRADLEILSDRLGSLENQMQVKMMGIEAALRAQRRKICGLKVFILKSMRGRGVLQRRRWRRRRRARS